LLTLVTQDGAAEAFMLLSSSVPPAPGAGAVRNDDACAELRNAPGAAEGERHDTALRLIGSALARGGNPIDVLRVALAWAQRCDPPFEPDEVERIVRDLSEKDRKRAGASAIVAEAPWPTFPTAALHGLAGEIVQAILPVSEADPAALLGQLLVSV